MSKPFIFALLIAGFCNVFNNASQAQNKNYHINTSNSLVVWYCQENLEVPVVHSGSFMFAEGSFTSTGNELTGGSFEIDMTSLIDNDIKDKTENHALLTRLAGKDFFNIKDYPRARFTISQITKVKGQEYVLEGKLSLKGITRDFRIPVVVKITDSQLELISDTALIEGAQFGMKTGTGTSELRNFKIRISQLFAKKV